MARARHRIPAETVREMHAFYWDRGLDFDAVAILFKIGATTVRRLFHDHGLPVRPPPGRPSPLTGKACAAAEVAEMYAFYQAGRSLAETGKKFRRGSKSVGAIFRRRGLELRHVGRPPEEARRPDGTFGSYTPATPEVIEAAIQAATRIKIPEHLRLDWRKWDMERRRDFIDRIRAKLNSPDDRPDLPFSPNVEPFDYCSPRAREIVERENAGTTSRVCPSKIKLTSQGVIWNDKLWFWVWRVGYASAGGWTPEHGRPALHRVIWEDHHGRPVPPGYCVRHADGNPNNLDPENLELIDRNVLARENQAAGLLAKSRERVGILLNRQPHQSNDTVHHLIERAS